MTSRYDPPSWTSLSLLIWTQPLTITNLSMLGLTHGRIYQVASPLTHICHAQPHPMTIDMPHMRNLRGLGHQTRYVLFGTQRTLSASGVAPWAIVPMPVTFPQTTPTSQPSPTGKMGTSSTKLACQSALSSMSKVFAQTQHLPMVPTHSQENVGAILYHPGKYHLWQAFPHITTQHC